MSLEGISSKYTFLSHQLPAWRRAAAVVLAVTAIALTVLAILNGAHVAFHFSNSATIYMALAAASALTLFVIASCQKKRPTEPVKPLEEMRKENAFLESPLEYMRKENAHLKGVDEVIKEKCALAQIPTKDEIGEAWIGHNRPEWEKQGSRAPPERSLEALFEKFEKKKYGVVKYRDGFAENGKPVFKYMKKKYDRDGNLWHKQIEMSNGIRVPKVIAQHIFSSLQEKDIFACQGVSSSFSCSSALLKNPALSQAEHFFEFFHKYLIKNDIALVQEIFLCQRSLVEWEDYCMLHIKSLLNKGFIDQAIKQVESLSLISFEQKRHGKEGFNDKLKGMQLEVIKALVAADRINDAEKMIGGQIEDEVRLIIINHLLTKKRYQDALYQNAFVDEKRIEGFAAIAMAYAEEGDFEKIGEILNKITTWKVFRNQHQEKACAYAKIYGVLIAEYHKRGMASEADVAEQQMLKKIREAKEENTVTFDEKICIGRSYALAVERLAQSQKFECAEKYAEKISEMNIQVDAFSILALELTRAGNRGKTEEILNFLAEKTKSAKENSYYYILALFEFENTKSNPDLAQLADYLAVPIYYGVNELDRIEFLPQLRNARAELKKRIVDAMLKAKLWGVLYERAEDIAKAQSWHFEIGIRFLLQIAAALKERKLDEEAQKWCRKVEKLLSANRGPNGRFHDLLAIAKAGGEVSWSELRMLVPKLDKKYYTNPELDVAKAKGGIDFAIYYVNKFYMEDLSQAAKAYRKAQKMGNGVKQAHAALQDSFVSIFSSFLHLTRS